LAFEKIDMMQNRINLKLTTLIAEMTDTKNHSELMVIASKIVDLDGRCDSAKLTDAEIWEAALEIVRRQQYEEVRQTGYRKPVGDKSGAVLAMLLAVWVAVCVFLVVRWLVGMS
jgi:hypothetical protein